MRDNLFQSVDIKTIPAKGMSFELTATEEECRALSERFQIPGVQSFKLTGTVKGNDILCYQGQFEAHVTQKCVVSLEEFEQTVQGDFKEFFSQTGRDFSTETDFDIDMEEETVDLIKNGRLEIGEIAVQQFGLSLEAFPKKTDTFFEYKEVENGRENPFAVLGKLIKK